MKELVPSGPEPLSLSTPCSNSESSAVVVTNECIPRSPSQALVTGQLVTKHSVVSGVREASSSGVTTNSSQRRGDALGSHGFPFPGRGDRAGVYAGGPGDPRGAIRDLRVSGGPFGCNGQSRVSAANSWGL